MSSNRLKSKTPPPPDATQIKQEAVQEVTVEEVVKDRRTSRFVGIGMLLLTLVLFISFISYLFTWEEDQDKIFQFGIRIFAVDDVRIANLMGVLGAYIAHYSIYYGFGMASLLICLFSFALGINLVYEKRIFRLGRILRNVVLSMFFISVCLSFFTPLHAMNMSIGGAVGEMTEAWLVKWIGKTGTAFILIAIVCAYLIYRFNPTFTWPERKPRAVAETGDEESDEESPIEPAFESAVTTAVPPPKPNFGRNRLRKKPEDEEAEVAAAAAQMQIVEREEEPEFIVETPVDGEGTGRDLSATIEDEDEAPWEEPGPVMEIPPAPPVPPVSTKASKPSPSFDLEIKNEVTELPEVDESIFDEEDDEEEEVLTPAQKVLAQPNFEPTLDLQHYRHPDTEMLETHGSEKIITNPEELEGYKNQIIETLSHYDIAITKISATVGPTVTLYEIVPAPGVRISRIKNLEDDIALSLAALGIRIIAPIPGKGTIGIEVPNVRKTVVSMKTLLASDKFQNTPHQLPIAIGKRIDNEMFIVDLATMPHLLVAGATGQGKSVGINALLVSLLYKKHPSQLKFVLIDPKKVELSLYRCIENHFLAKLPGEEESIITDTKKVINTLNALCIEMDNRYDLLKEAGCRNIREYNEKFVQRRLNPQKGHQYLPFIVLVIDEFADLIMTAGKEVEMPIARLAQLARAIGIHLIIATQRPSVNIITGTIKANFPARIAFKVSSKIDSRTILDTGGAEQLIGKGDMLVSYNGELVRLQCAFVDTPEVEKVCEFIAEQQGYPQPFLLPEYIDEKEMSSKDFDPEDKDPLFEEAARLIVQNQMGSTSLIQRRMKLGYNRAGRLMDQLEAAGIVGANQGSKAREVIVKTELELEDVLATI